MKVIARHAIENCIDGSSVFNYEVSEPWTDVNVRRLATLGDFEYFADFPRPLFRLRTRTGLFVNGVAGSAICRVILPRTDRNAVQKQLEDVLVSEA